MEGKIKTRFKMTTEELEQLKQACTPVPYLIVGGREPVSPQESANYFWSGLADKYGFVWNTARPVAGEDPCVFTAVPLK